MEKVRQFVNFKEINEKAAMKAKLQDFMESSYHCKHFQWKEEDKKTKTAWCGCINAGCKYCKCPKIKHNDG